MSRQLAWTLSGFCLLLAMASASAANLVVYDDQSENGFQDGCSFGGVANDFDVANTTVVHSGTHSVRFTPDHFNAVSWCAPATYSATTDYTGIDFWVNGGATGSQNVNLVLGLAGNPVAHASLTVLQGIPLGANLWTHFQVSFSPGALNYTGQFDQISLQDESGAVQADMYFDDVSLVPAAAASGQNYVFSDSFEPEYMLVPQYGSFDGGGFPTVGSNRIKVYQRTTNTANFSSVGTAVLAAGIHPNALAFAPDGNLWVVDDGNATLRRYSLQSILQSIALSTTATSDRNVGPIGDGTSSIFDLAFFGDYAYVSQSNLNVNGGTDQILKFSIANLNAGTNTSTSLTDAIHPMSVPAGIAFDAQGRLWISNCGCPFPGGGTASIMRMNTTTGSIDKVGSSVTVPVSLRASLSNPEGVAFDDYGSLWVGNNGEPTVSIYTDALINGAGFGATQPDYQLDIAPGVTNPGANHTGFVGGVIFDRHGDLRANYENTYSVLGYTFTAGYAFTALTPLSNATTDPGRGGVAIWPVPSTVHR